MIGETTLAHLHRRAFALHILEHILDRSLVHKVAQRLPPLPVLRLPLPLAITVGERAGAKAAASAERVRAAARLVVRRGKHAVLLEVRVGVEVRGHALRAERVENRVEGRGVAGFLCVVLLLVCSAKV